MVAALDTTAADTYRYLNFDELPDFVDAADFDLSPEARAAAANLDADAAARAVAAAG